MSSNVRAGSSPAPGTLKEMLIITSPFLFIFIYNAIQINNSLSFINSNREIKFFHIIII